MKNTNGLTLLEILIVMLIIGIIASFAVLATGDFGASRRVHASAKLLSQKINLASEQAILQGSVLGLRINQKGYGFYHFQFDRTGEHGQWIAIKKDELLRHHDVKKGIQLHLQKPKINTTSPQIVFTPNGTTTAFTLELSIHQKPPLYRLEGEPNGTIKLTELTS